MADPSVRVKPVFKPLPAAPPLKRSAAPLVSTTKGPPKLVRNSDTADPLLQPNIMTSHLPTKRQVEIFDEAELYNPPVKVKKTTVLRIKRKRDEQSLDAIVLEAPASKKRELADLADSMQVLNIKSSEDKSTYEQTVELIDKTGDLHLNHEDTKSHLAESFKQRELNRRIFRYVGTVGAAGKFTSDQVHRKLVEMRDRTSVTDTKTPETMKQQRVDAWKNNSRSARFQELSRLRRVAASESTDRALNVLELVSQNGPEAKEQLPAKNTASQRRAVGATLPVIKSAKKMAEDDYVVDYFVYDADAVAEDDPNLPTESCALVALEKFDEALLDDEFVPDNEYSDEFDSDDSQNKDWDYPSESESSSDVESSGSSSSVDERRVVYDPFSSRTRNAGNISAVCGPCGSDDDDGMVLYNRDRENQGYYSSGDDDEFDHYGEKYTAYEERGGSDMDDDDY